MKILHVRPVAHQGGGRFRDVADFDVEINDGLRLNCLRLALAPDGRKFVFSPSKNGARFASFTGDFARIVASAAFDAMEGRVADVSSRH